MINIDILSSTYERVRIAGRKPRSPQGCLAFKKAMREAGKYMGAYENADDEHVVVR